MEGNTHAIIGVTVGAIAGYQVQPDVTQSQSGRGWRRFGACPRLGYEWIGKQPDHSL